MINIKLNKIIKYLIYSDLIFYTGWGLISPIFSIFLLQNIVGASVFVIGIAAAINLIVRSIVRVPFGMYSDKTQKISFNLMFWGLLLTSLIPLGYLYSTQTWHICVLQAIYGLVIAMSVSGWTSIFSKHMDHGKESTEWGIDAVAVGLGPGIAAAIGGVIAQMFGYPTLFVAVTIFGLVGTILLLVIRKEIINCKTKDNKPCPLHVALKNRIKRNHNGVH
jgi:MFS family permease